MAKTTLNPLTDTPANLTQLTQSFMLEYIRAKNDPETSTWFKELCHAHKTKKKNNLTGKTATTVDVKAVRQEFASKFFPNLLVKKKKQGKSFLDMVDEL